MDEVCPKIEEWMKEGAELDRITFSEAINDSAITIQGEVQEGINGWDLRYSNDKVPMRKAMDKCLHAKGLTARMMLEHHMDSASLDDLKDLLDTYPGAVVEFTTLSEDLGLVPRRNTVFWEVRHF
jgi:hypothetical protein